MDIEVKSLCVDNIEKADFINDKYLQINNPNNIDINNLDIFNTLNFDKYIIEHPYFLPYKLNDKFTLNTFKRWPVSRLAANLLLQDTININISIDELVQLVIDNNDIKLIWYNSQHLNMKHRIFLIQFLLFYNKDHENDELIMDLLKDNLIELKYIRNLIWFNPQGAYILGYHYVSHLTNSEQLLMLHNCNNYLAHELCTLRINYYSIEVLKKYFSSIALEQLALICNNAAYSDKLDQLITSALKKLYKNLIIPTLKNSQIDEIFCILYINLCNFIYNKSISKQLKKIFLYYSIKILHYTNLKVFLKYQWFSFPTIIYKYFIKQTLKYIKNYPHDWKTINKAEIIISTFSEELKNNYYTQKEALTLLNDL